MGGSGVRHQGVSVTVALATAGLLLWTVGGSGQSAGTIARCLAAGFVVMQLQVFGQEVFDIEYGVVTVQALSRVEARVLEVRPAGTAPPPGDTPPLVRFQDVTFRYPGSSRAVIDRLTLEIRPGETLAIVGVNGAGKTTLVKLMAGLYQPTSGRITVDGVDVRELDADRWRGRMTALFQDFVHYRTTVAENVVMSAPEHRQDHCGVRAALDAAGAGPMISRLPQGIDTSLWTGSAGGFDLSGGQWQTLAIARVLFAIRHGRRLLILDEPTAHLDAEAEQRFNQRIAAGALGASVVLISHRLSNVRTADRIVVLDGGRITESGTHDDLVALGGVYARLFKLQASRFSEVTK